MESLREELCGCIREMNVVLGKDREYYINIIILVLTIIQTRMLRKKYNNQIEKTVVFHQCHW